MNTPSPKPNTLIVQFFLHEGVIVSWPVPAEHPFLFGVMCSNIRASGCFMTDDLYIPESEIACIGLAGGTARVRNPSIPPQPQHPTKQ